MNRFFIEADLHVDTQLLLTESVFHHWVRVLRAQLNDQAVFLMVRAVNIMSALLK